MENENFEQGQWIENFEQGQWVHADNLMSTDVNKNYTGSISILHSKEVATFKINNVTVSVSTEKDIPNKLVRFMQKKILGIEWNIPNPKKEK